jgi:hypothetical protein
MDHQCFRDTLEWFRGERAALLAEFQRRVSACGAPPWFQRILGGLCRRSGENLVNDFRFEYERLLSDEERRGVGVTKT